MTFPHQIAKLLYLCISGLTFFVSVVAEAAPIEVLGHRGARASRPENTIPAFAFALEQGVDTLEMDVQLSKDGQLVVVHDEILPAKLCRSMDGQPLRGRLAIRDLTFAQLKAIDCGSQRHDEFQQQITVPQTSIPTLEEVFRLVASSPLAQARTVKFQIEAKTSPRKALGLENPRDIADVVIRIAKEFGMLDRIIVQSFDHRVLLAAKQLEPKVRTAALLGQDFPDWNAVIKASQVDVISPHMDWVTPEAVRVAHGHGVRVVPYTANQEADWSYLLSCGVDGIITDDPQGLISYLRNHASRLETKVIDSQGAGPGSRELKIFQNS